MKKKLLAALLAVIMTVSMTACGSTESNQGTEDKDAADSNAQETATELGSVSTKDYNVDEYVTIGDYSGLDVAVNVYTFTDEDVESQLQKDFEAYVDYADAYEYDTTEKDTVETGDIVNLDYSGKKDGEAFDGGTAQGAHLEIGSGSFIDGFEDGLIGHVIGDAFDLPLTFPENYSPDLAGQDVVFEVKINSIDERKLPDLTDEIVAGMGMEFQTVDEYRQGMREYIESACSDQNQSEKESAIWKAVYELCEVKDAPQAMIDDIKARIASNVQTYADYYQLSVGEFIQQNMGITEEEYNEQTEQSAQNSAKEKLAVAALAKQAGIELTDDDVRAFAETEYETYGYESVEEMYEDVGIGSYYDYVLTEKLYEYLAETVKVTENDPVSITELMNS